MELAGPGGDDEGQDGVRNSQRVKCHDYLDGEAMGGRSESKKGGRSAEVSTQGGGYA